MTLADAETPSWPASAEALGAARAFLERQAGCRVVLVPDKDVDGLSAGVQVERALTALGARVQWCVPAKGEHAHHPALLARAEALAPEALVVLDMGSRAEPLLPGVATLVVDHHAPEGFPPGAGVLSAHGHEPVAPTSLLAHVLVRPFVEPEALEWLAVLGTLADHGATAPFPGFKEALRRAGRKAATESVALLNAARRSARFSAETALQVLREAPGARDIAEGRVAGVEQLRDFRLEVQHEVARCARTPPRFAGDVALLLFSSAAQVHPLVAVRWAQRLPRSIVLAANTGYLPGRVNFVLRSRQDLDLIALLKGLELPDMGGDFARGHARATGGSLPPEAFARLLEALGFRGLGAGALEPRGLAPG
ncbi:MULTISPECIES: hypothetical protein [Myxococcaceae]|uniref:DHH family phosphoesterase n=1 Tax=Myxococcaceae TaxID=31 RepID=UPI001E390A91|nr:MULTISPECIES: hypothetical protein [Myxococcaceae]